MNAQVLGVKIDKTLRMYFRADRYLWEDLRQEGLVAGLAQEDMASAHLAATREMRRATRAERRQKAEPVGEAMFVLEKAQPRPGGERPQPKCKDPGCRGLKPSRNNVYCSTCKNNARRNGRCECGRAKHRVREKKLWRKGEKKTAPVQTFCRKCGP